MADPSNVVIGDVLTPARWNELIAWVINKINSITAVTKFNNRTGEVTLTTADVTTALGYTPAFQAKRQTVLTGGVDASGYANFLSVGSGLAVNLAASAGSPVIIGFSAGFGDQGAIDYTGKIIANATIDSLTALQTCYLYSEYIAGSLSFGHSLFAPVYAASAPITDIADITSSAAAISGGDNSTNVKGNAFNNDDTSTYWQSSQSSTGISGVSYIGQNFGSGKDIRRITLKQLGGSAYALSSIKVQYSDNGSSWSDAQTFSDLTMSQDTLLLSSSYGAHQYWRLLANNNPGTAWRVFEIEMFPGISVDQHWFDLSTFTMKRWAGSAWEIKNRVFLGEAITGASTVTSVITYALNGSYDSGWFAVAANTSYTKNHNIGLPLSHGLNIKPFYSDTGSDTNSLLAFPIYSINWAGHMIRSASSNKTAAVNLVFVGDVYISSPSGYYRLFINRNW